MKGQKEQEVFKSALEYTHSLWNTGSMSINQAIKLAAKQFKVNAGELGKHVFEYTKSKLRERTKC